MNPKTEKNLTKFLKGKICLFGFGNRMWRDDGAGSLLAEALSNYPGIDSVDGGFVPENHLEKVGRNNPDVILMIDTADFGGKPGEVRLLLPDDMTLTSLSTHAGSPQLLARYLEQRCGAQIALLAIQPANTNEGNNLSDEVKHTLRELKQTLKLHCSQ